MGKMQNITRPILKAWFSLGSDTMQYEYTESAKRNHKNLQLCGHLTTKDGGAAAVALSHNPSMNKI